MTPGVLLVGTFPPPDAGSAQPSDLMAERLAGRGWRVILTTRRRGRMAGLLDALSTIRRRRGQYGIAQVDVFSGRAFVRAEAACALLRRLGKPYVLALHGGRLPDFARRWPGRVRRLLQSARAVTAPSRWLAEELRAARSDIYVLPNPLDLDRYSFRVRSRPRPELVWLRAFHSVYDPELAVRVLARLAGEFPDARLTMVGPDKRDGSRGRAIREAKRSGVADRIAWSGGVPKTEVPGLLDAADVFLNTSTVDNAPVSVLEAMSSGLCVVSTDVGGMRWLVEDGREGLLVPPRDEGAMAEAVERVLIEPGLAGRLSSAARERAEAHASERIVEQWADLLSGVARGVVDA